MTTQIHLAGRAAKFHALAERCYAEILAFGKSISWKDARRCLEDRLGEKGLKRSKAPKMAGSKG